LADPWSRCGHTGFYRWLTVQGICTGRCKCRIRARFGSRSDGLTVQGIASGQFKSRAWPGRWFRLTVRGISTGRCKSHTWRPRRCWSCGLTCKALRPGSSRAVPGLGGASGSRFEGSVREGAIATLGARAAAGAAVSRCKALRPGSPRAVPDPVVASGSRFKGSIREDAKAAFGRGAAVGATVSGRKALRRRDSKAVSGRGVAPGSRAVGSVPGVAVSTLTWRRL
jgi:hypothetical protein